jgi:hypothetical protein
MNWAASNAREAQRHRPRPDDNPQLPQRPGYRGDFLRRIAVGCPGRRWRDGGGRLSMRRLDPRRPRLPICSSKVRSFGGSKMTSDQWLTSSVPNGRSHEVRREPPRERGKHPGAEPRSHELSAETAQFCALFGSTPGGGESRAGAHWRRERDGDPTFSAPEWLQTTSVRRRCANADGSELGSGG